MRILSTKDDRWYVVPDGPSSLDDYIAGDLVFGRRIETVSYLDAKGVEVIGDLEEACRVADCLLVVEELMLMSKN